MQHFVSLLIIKLLLQYLSVHIYIFFFSYTHWNNSMWVLVYALIVLFHVCLEDVVYALILIMNEVGSALRVCELKQT